MKYTIFGFVLLSFVFLGSCKKDKVCLSGDLKFIETAFEDAASIGTLFIDYKVVNTSSTDYSYKDEGTGKVFAAVVVKTTEGGEYETKKLVSVIPPNLSLPAGDTMKMTFHADYKEGETYKSHDLSLTCDE